MLEYKPKYLVMVASTSNNNKYYKMIPEETGWVAEYGRVGSSPQRRSYGYSLWQRKYNEKIKKGYTDQTDLIDDLIKKDHTKKSGYKEIENEAIAKIVQHLQDMAKFAIKENYIISSNEVTQAMVDEAQNVLTSLINKETVESFNETLINLFSVIPRKMRKVNQFIANDIEDFGKIIEREQDLLDVMRGQVVSKEKEIITEDIEENEHTILEQFGLEFEECDEESIKRIKHELGEISNKFDCAWKVTNLKTKERFDDYVKNNNIENVKLLFHGSRNENWWSIINTGLVLKPTNAVITGKLYGYGIYFAPKAKKSMGYTSFGYWTRGSASEGYMALMEVAYGKPYDVYDFDSKYGNLNKERLKDFKEDANCLHAHAGANMGHGRGLLNDEIVVYDDAQCTIKYLVRLKP